ncbi:hypothetical protein [Paraferrimonas sp. SM1919]|uniref:hypothetical protein n=1 Tax=Paraferrimonas sp. SM1919 TaxID=2662263 RepID=UPI0013D16144|nr:hypothetical protein [Paraferrimonas sp. SM1919]
MKCPQCAKLVRLAKLEEYQVDGAQRYMKCTHCGAWLKNSKIALLGKGAAFYLAVIMLACGYWQWLEASISYPIAIIATILMFVLHLMDQLAVVDEPPKK